MSGEATWEALTTAEDALNGGATRKDIRIGLTGSADGPSCTLLLYLPTALRQQGHPVPLFLG